MVALGMEDDRRCVHCGTGKTPMWRCGPEGSKSLCNACGIRWKKGTGDSGDGGDRAARTGPDEAKFRGSTSKMKKKQTKKKKKKKKRVRTVVRETETTLIRCHSDSTLDFIDVFNYRCLFPGLMVVDKERGF
mmetsp:Transcript_17930/g.71802  ORF Transcript_17930/g.71802 Transcript_17930/m.71802 type:complete len:132 (-) Transcript_17930:207-602(-)